MMQPLNRSLRACAAVVALMVASTTASAQPTLDRWKGLDPSALQTVFVRDSDGVETSGKLLALSPDSLTLLVDGVERQVDLKQITRIQKRDSLKNGTIAGAIVGFAMGLISGGLADCSYQSRSNNCLGFRVGMLALSTGVYAGLGAGIDAMIPGRTTLYAAPAQPAPSASARTSSPPAMLHVGVSW